MFILKKKIQLADVDFTFTDAGKYEASDGSKGSWKVNAANQLEIASGTHVAATFDVLWSFDRNKLVLKPATGAFTLWNFHDNDSPRITLNQKNLLNVHVIHTGFEFQLTPSQFEFHKENGYLSFKIGTSLCELQGEPSDFMEMFTYRYTVGANFQTLHLQGAWVKSDQAGEEGSLKLLFNYQINDAGPYQIDVPTMGINPFKNTLAFSYQSKDGRKACLVQGDIEIKDNKLRFTLLGSPNTLSFDLVGEWSPDKGIINQATYAIALQKQNGKEGSIVRLGGKVTFKLSDDLGGIDLNFEYRKISEIKGDLPASSAIEIATGLRYASRDNQNIFTLLYTRTNNEYELKLDASTQLQLGPSSTVLAKAGLLATLSDGSKRSIEGFISFSWKS